MSDDMHLTKYIGWETNLTDNQRDSYRWVSLCGLNQGSSSFDFTFPSREGSFGEFAAHEPTCEACILLHFANPEGTEHLED